MSERDRLRGAILAFQRFAVFVGMEGRAVELYRLPFRQAIWQYRKDALVEALQKGRLRLAWNDE